MHIARQTPFCYFSAAFLAIICTTNPFVELCAVSVFLRKWCLTILLILTVSPAMLRAQEYPPSVPWPATQWNNTAPVGSAPPPPPGSTQLPPWPGQQWPAPQWTGQQTPTPYIRPLPELIPQGQMVLPPVEGPSVPPPSAETFIWDQPAVEPPPKPWEASFELGLNGTDGNSETFNIYVGSEFERKGPLSTFTLDLDYTNNSSSGITTANRYLMDGRYERKFAEESRWELYFHSTLELDEFKAFDQRITADMGLGYLFIKNDLHELKGRAGAGFSREIGGPDDSWVPEGVFGLDYELRISERQKLSLSTDYYPAWEDFHDYRLKTRADWEILLDEATNLSLKLGALNNYDSTPNGAKPNDLDYTAVLLWKY
jgi:hypothetical protein